MAFSEEKANRVIGFIECPEAHQGRVSWQTVSAAALAEEDRHGCIRDDPGRGSQHPAVLQRLY